MSVNWWLCFDRLLGQWKYLSQLAVNVRGGKAARETWQVGALERDFGLPDGL